MEQEINSLKSWPSYGKLWDDIFSGMAPHINYIQLFEQMPNVHLFIKDCKSRLIYSSTRLLNRLGLTDPKDLVGQYDDIFFPSEVADRFRVDDQQVIRSGQPLLNRVELCYNDSGMLDWFTTNKWPLRAADGRILGIIATMQSYEDRLSTSIPFSDLSRVLEYIRTYHRQRISVEHLADLAGISTRQLSRKFHQEFGMSVKTFLIRSRIQSACEKLIHSAKPLAHIALDHGYHSQSAFTSQFRKHIGMTPLAYRRRYRTNR